MLSFTHPVFGLRRVIHLHLRQLSIQMILWGLPRWCSDREPACQCRRCMRCGLDPRVRKTPWSGRWQPTPAFLPGKFHRQRSPVGPSPWADPFPWADPYIFKGYILWSVLPFSKAVLFLKRTSYYYYLYYYLVSKPGSPSIKCLKGLRVLVAPTRQNALDLWLHRPRKELWVESKPLGKASFPAHCSFWGLEGKPE